MSEVNGAVKPRFGPRDVAEIEGMLREIQSREDIGWSWVQSGEETFPMSPGAPDELVVKGLNGEAEIIFTGWRTAKAGLSPWLAGFAAGFDAGCCELANDEYRMDRAEEAAG